MRRERFEAQKGIASLLTAVILLIGATIFLFTSSNSIRGQLQLSANTYRTEQASEAAQAGIDHGLMLFNSRKQKIDPTINSGNPTSISLPNNASATFYYANSGSDDRCNSNGAEDTATLISTGTSDDGTASRTISVCLGVAPIFTTGEGPRQPFVSGGSIANAGNTSVINRYTNISIWAGGGIGSAGAAFGTYLRPSNTQKEDYSVAELLSFDTSNTQQLSDSKSGYGLDVVVNDPSLDNLNADEFWCMFFKLGRNAFFNQAEWLANTDSLGIDINDPEVRKPDFSSFNDITGGGTVWVGAAPSYSTSPSEGGDPCETGSYDGEPDIPVEEYPNDISPSLPKAGTNDPSAPEAGIGVIDLNDHENSSSPAIIIVNGDLTLNAGDKIYGILYVTGTLKVNGTATVFGSVITENGPNDLGGTLNIVYSPIGGEGEPDVQRPTAGAVIPGSWKDF